MAITISTVAIAADGKTVTFTCTGVTGAITSASIPNDANNYVRGLAFMTDKVRFVAGSCTITSATTVTALLDVATDGYVFKSETIRAYIAAAVFGDGTGTSSSLSNKVTTNSSNVPATMYFNSATGTSTGGRTHATPVDSFANVPTITDGATFYLAGHFREPLVVSWNSPTIAADPAASALYTKTETLPDGSTLSVPIYWTVRSDPAAIAMTNVAATEVWYADVANEPNFAAENLDMTAADPKGWYTKVDLSALGASLATAAAGLTSRGQWGWVAVAGTAHLFCRGYSGQSLASGVVTYGIDGSLDDSSTPKNVGLMFFNVSNPTVSGGGVLGWTGDTGTVEESICLGMMGCTGTITVSGCHVVAGGNHNLGIQNASTGTANVTNCIFDMQRSGSGSDGGNLMVGYTNSAGTPLRVNVTNCVARIRTLLRANGTALVQTTIGGSAFPRADYTVDGFFAHSNTADKLELFLCTNCVAIFYNVGHGDGCEFFGTGFGSGTNVKGPTAAADATTYPYRTVGCELRYPSGTQNNTASPFAWLRMKIDGVSTDKTITTTDVTTPIYFGAAAGNNAVALDACSISWDTSPAFATQAGVIACESNCKNLYMTNCTIRQNGTTNALDGVLWIFTPDNGAGSGTIVHANGCVFSNGHGAGVLATENSTDHFTAANFLAVGCWYTGMRTTANGYLYATTAFDTKAEYLAGIDPTGVYDVTPGFTNTTNGSVNLEGTPSSALRTMQRAQQIHTSTGINNRDYSGNYGAYQYGGAGGGATGRRNRVGGGRQWRVR